MLGLCQIEPDVLVFMSMVFFSFRFLGMCLFAMNVLTFNEPWPPCPVRVVMVSP